MPLHLDSIVNSTFNSITYILSDTEQKGLWLIDCGDVENLDVSQGVIGVLLTHIHYDHIYGLNHLLRRSPETIVYTNDFGKEGLLNPKINLSKYFPGAKPFYFTKPESVCSLENQSFLTLFDHEARIFPVPGHDPSCLAFLIDGRLFTGDALIPGEKVIVSFPHSNRSEAKASERQLRELGERYPVLPGHAPKNS